MKRTFFVLLKFFGVKHRENANSARKNGEKRRKLLKRRSVASEKQLLAHEYEHEHEITAKTMLAPVWKVSYVL